MTEQTNGGNVCTPNTAIHCTVSSCAHHCRSAQYCGLGAILVGTRGGTPAQGERTDCKSFEAC